MVEASRADDGKNVGIITIGQIFRCARVLLTENWRRSLPVWVAIAIVEFWDASSGSLLDEHPLVAAASSLASVALSLVLWGVAIRAMIGSLEGVWSCDRAFLRYAKASFILVLPIFIVAVISVFLAQFGLLLLGSIVIFVFAIAVNLRGMLWPIGQLLGDESASFQQSAIRMRGVLASAFFAYFVVGLVLAVPKIAMVAMTFLRSGSVAEGVPSILLQGTLGTLRAVAGITVTSSIAVLVSLRDKAEPQ